MIDPQVIEDLSRRLSAIVPEGARELREDLEKNFRAVLGSAFAKLDLVTREELDVQRGVLARTREKVELLEARIAELESTLRARQGGGPPEDTGAG